MGFLKLQCSFCIPLHPTASHMDQALTILWMKRWMVMEEPKCYQERIMGPEREKDWFGLLRSPPCSFGVNHEIQTCFLPCQSRNSEVPEAMFVAAGFVRGLDMWISGNKWTDRRTPHSDRGRFLDGRKRRQASKAEQRARWR